jgi:hypothetical protein
VDERSGIHTDVKGVATFKHGPRSEGRGESKKPTRVAQAKKALTLNEYNKTHDSYTAVDVRRQ